MIPIISYDNDMPEDWDDSMTDALTRICEKLIEKYGTIAKYGFFGTWDGPRYGGSLIDDAKELRGHICQDFTVNMSWELVYAGEQENIEEIQRYCSPTLLAIPPKSILLRQWHHDGCNCYILRPLTVKGDYEGAIPFNDWCKDNTGSLELEGVI